MIFVRFFEVLALRPPAHSVQPATQTMQATSRPPSSRPAASPNPNPNSNARPVPPYQVNTQTKVLDTHHGRLLCIADIRGKLSSLNDLAREANAKAIIHTGDFGFFGARITWRSSAAVGQLLIARYASQPRSIRGQQS